VCFVKSLRPSRLIGRMMLGFGNLILCLLVTFSKILLFLNEADRWQRLRLSFHTGRRHNRQHSCYTGRSNSGIGDASVHVQPQFHHGSHLFPHILYILSKGGTWHTMLPFTSPSEGSKGLDLAYETSSSCRWRTLLRESKSGPLQYIAPLIGVQIRPHRL